jgi:hypothetical protein
MRKSEIIYHHACSMDLAVDHLLIVFAALGNQKIVYLHQNVVPPFSIQHAEACYFICACHLCLLLW